MFETATNVIFYFYKHPVFRVDATKGLGLLCLYQFENIALFLRHELKCKVLTFLFLKLSLKDRISLNRQGEQLAKSSLKLFV